MYRDCPKYEGERTLPSGAVRVLCALIRDVGGARPIFPPSVCGECGRAEPTEAMRRLADRYAVTVATRSAVRGDFGEVEAALVRLAEVLGDRPGARARTQAALVHAVGRGMPEGQAAAIAKRMWPEEAHGHSR